MGNLFSSKSSTWQATSRNVLITGASRGIGAELARNFAKEGARLALLARNKDGMKDIAEECKQLGAERVETYSCDLTENKQIETACLQAIQDFEGFDVVVLNAGRSQGCYFEEIQDIDQIDYMLKLNIGGVVITLQKLLPAVFKSKHSRIVVVSSTAGIIPVPYRSVYCASKAALNGFCGSVRMELIDTYADAAPHVCVINFPEVKGTSLNTGRMDFGAKLKPVQFKNEAASDLKPACELCMGAIRQGQRSWGEPTKVKILLPLYSFIPGILEVLIMRHLKKTHFRPGIEES
jgi:short-subunit dehydrogenase